MLKGKLYKVNAIELQLQDQKLSVGQKYTVSVNLDSSHDIFKGHFPGNPILPGVCQVEMVRELVEDILGRKFMLSQAGQIKYFSVINPALNPLLQLNLRINDTDRDEFNVSAEITAGDIVFMKMKGIFKEFKA
ncbi:MAG: 3-hydroxyacyl-ACP dehydratase [Bacteroidetes bacterium]|nr:3-hydroxyacyl-ACP dehydratase [Bacteroidota bacterium]